MTRVITTDLVPATNYKVQVRAVSDGQYSEWSESFTFTTTQNLTAPAAPATVTWVVSDDAFAGTWTEVTQDLAGNPAFITAYELEMVSGATTVIVTVPAQKGMGGTYTLDFPTNTSLFGTPVPSIALRVRAVNNKNVKGTYSGAITATNAVPANVSGFTATAMQDGVELAWTANTENDIDRYEVYTSTVSSGFTPSGANLIFKGKSTRLVYKSSSYVTNFFKVRAYDKFNQPSATDASASATPTSPFVLDTTAPSTPTSLAGTITNNANGIGASAVLTWVMASPPADLAGYNIRYRPVSTTPYQYMNGIDSGVLTATVQYLAAYTNYEFQIQAYDFLANRSAWSSTLTVTSPSNAAPAVPTALTSSPTDNTITYAWANSDVDIYNYEVTFSTSSTFASGNVTYLTGTAKSLTVGGLTAGTTYYARVRSVDTAGSTSAFTGTNTTATLGLINSDGLAPTTSPAATVMARFNGLYVTWTPVTNNDPVTYEVHLSTTTGFTPSGVTKVTEVSGASMLITNLPGTSTALTYGTTYFVKLIAKDKDGAAAAGTQGSGVPVKVASSDVTSIGADLIVPGSGFITNLVINSGGSIQSSDYVASTTGFKLNTTGGLEVNTGSVKANLLTAGTLTSSTGVIQIGSGASIVMNGGYLKSNTYTGTAQATNPSGAGFYLGNDGIRIDQGIVSAAAITTGTIGAQTITIGAGGSIVGGGWTLSSSGLSIPAGAITAASLTLQNSPNIVPAPYGSFEVVGNSMFTGVGALLHGPVATPKFGATAYSTIMSPTASNCQLFLGKSVTDYNIVVEAGKTYIVSCYVWVAGTTATPMTMKVKYSDTTTATVNTPTLTTSMTAATAVRAAGTITVPAGVTGMEVYFETGTTTGTGMGWTFDGLQVEEKVGNASTPTGWKPTGMTTIDGGMVKTGSIQSTAGAIDAEGNAISGQLAWSIDTQGSATLGNVNIRGLLVMGVVGDFTSSIAPDGTELNLTGVSQMQSANYNQGQTGWAIRSNGVAEFRQLKANSITADSIQAVNPDDINGGSITSPLVLATQLIAQESQVYTYTDRTSTSTAMTFTIGTHSRQPGDRISVKGDPIIPTLRAITSNVATLTVPTGHGIQTGDSITVSGYTSPDTIFNGTFTVTGFTSTTVTFALVNANVTSGAGAGNPTISNNSVDTPGNSYDVITAVGTGTFTIARTRTAQATVTFTGTAKFLGRSAIMDPTGITLYDNDGISPVVILPTSAGSDAYFAGAINATSLVVRDNFSLQGDNNILNAGSTLTLNNGIVAPATSPSISQGYDFVTTDGTTNLYGLHWDGSFYTTVQNFFGAAVIRYKTSGERLVTISLPLAGTGDPSPLGPYGGITRVGTSWYVLGATYANGTFQVREYNAGMTAQTNLWTYDLHAHASYNVTTNQWLDGFAGILKDPVIGTDGTSLYIARCDTAGRIKIAKFNVAGTLDTSFGSSGVMSTGIVDFQNLRGMQVGVSGGFDYGAVTRYLVTTEGNSNKPSRTYSYNGTTAQPNEYFYSPNQNHTAGIIWNNTSANFVTLGAGGTIYQHTGIALNGSQAWSAKSSWYDGDTASIVPTARVLTSNVATFTVPSGHGYVTDDVFTVAGYTGSDVTFNGAGRVVTGVTATTISTAITATNVTTGAGTGSPTISTLAYESPLSKQVDFTVIRRAKLTLTSGNIPDSGRHNDPDRSRFYVSNDRTNWWRQTDLAVGGKSQTYIASPTFSGSNGPGTAFPSGTAAQFVSSNGKLQLNADGWGLFGATADASTAAGNRPALRVGDIAGVHLRIDGNEIISMSSDTVQSTLVLNAGGTTQMNIATIAGAATIGNGLQISSANGLLTVSNNGPVQFNSLNSTNGSNNANSGPMYCRVGAAGILFSSTTAPSSRDIKHDIKPLELDYRKILELQPMTYRYNEMPDTLRVGFIAEDAHDLGLGEVGLVGYEDHDDPNKVTGFDYDGFDAALLVVVKEQQKQLDAQADLLVALRADLDALRS